MMKRKNPGILLFIVGLVSIILSLTLAGCGDSNNAAALPAVSLTTQPATTQGVNGTPATTQAVTSTVTTPTSSGQSQPGSVSNPLRGNEPGNNAGQPTPTTTAAETKGYPGKIVFDTADQQIIVINPDGSRRQKVADGFSPLFSPDGQQIAYLTRSNGTPLDSRLTINTVNLDGSNPQELCSTGGNVEAKLVRWSPHNRFIAMTATQQDGPGTVYLCNVDDHSLNRGISTTQGQVVGLYDWTPEGNYAVWQAGKDLDFNLYYGDPDKSGEGAVALTGGQSRLESEINKFRYYPAARISPDGKTLAVGGGSLLFLGLPGQNNPLKSKIYKGGEVQSLAWSPDGRALVLVSLEPSAGKMVPVLTVQDFSGAANPYRTLVLDTNIGTSVDWSRQ